MFVSLPWEDRSASRKTDSVEICNTDAARVHRCESSGSRARPAVAQPLASHWALAAPARSALSLAAGHITPDEQDAHVEPKGLDCPLVVPKCPHSGGILPA